MQRISRNERFNRVFYILDLRVKRMKEVAVGVPHLYRHVRFVDNNSTLDKCNPPLFCQLCFIYMRILSFQVFSSLSYTFGKFI